MLYVFDADAIVVETAGGGEDRVVSTVGHTLAAFVEKLRLRRRPRSPVPAMTAPAGSPATPRTASTAAAATTRWSAAAGTTRWSAAAGTTSTWSTASADGSGDRFDAVLFARLDGAPSITAADGAIVG